MKRRKDRWRGATEDPNDYIYCKYCGSKLKRDIVGKYCPDKNCGWGTGT